MCLQHTMNAMMTPDAFAERFVGWVNGGAMMLMTSVGHRTGLFDAMDAMRLEREEAGDGTLGATSHEIASRAGLNERYVREWLGAMATGGVVMHDHASGRYVLPGAHAAMLTRRASPSNLASAAQWIAVLGSVEEHVVDAFGHGRGIPYPVYGDRFHDVMAEESNQTTIGGMDAHILPLVPRLVEMLDQGVRAIDIGCGKGLAMVHLAARFPRSTFVGVDLFDAALKGGRAEAAARGLKNVELIASDVTSFGEPGSFDVAFAFDAIHDQARPAEVLANIRRILRPGGLFLMQDIKARTAVADNMDHPMAPFIYTISCMHCMSVSLAADGNGGGVGLGAAWGKELAKRMLHEAGFASVSVHELEHDMLNYYYVCE